MASSLSMAGGSSSPDTEPALAGEMKSDQPIGRYFLYRLVEDQKDVGYKKLLSSDIISDAQRILLEYLDLPPQHAQEQDHSQGMLDITRCWCTSCAGLTTLSPGCSILTVQYTFSILSLRPLLNILETKHRSQRTNRKSQV